ncbi:MAG: hypothetical protein JWO08_2444, partial [Verrucomicrobiaceae bacterium]|nr:hypothetical protein [Verrucomicrobiaceae bacterium]
MHTFPLVSAVVLILALNSSAAESGWSLKASAKPFKVTGKLFDEKNVSAVAGRIEGRLILF